MNTEEVVKEILRRPEIKNNFEVVGSWVWCSFEEKPSIEILNFLRSLGFRWNRKRRVWQNACGVRSRSTEGDPKAHYQVIPLRNYNLKVEV